MFISKILISDEFDAIKGEMIAKFGLNNLRFIPKEEPGDFLIQHAKEVQKESYLSEVNEKIIVIMGTSFREEAQNFLLKLLEEPPKNIKFLIITPSKNLLLPTIKSRLICEKRQSFKPKQFLEFDAKKLDLKTAFDYIVKNEWLDKNSLSEQISLLTREFVRHKDFSENELELFYKAYELSFLNSRPYALLSALILNFLDKK